MPRIGRGIVLLHLTAGLFFYSCGILPSAARTGVLDATTETMRNGYLIQLRVDRPVGPVTALLSQGRWLVVTIADSLLDASALESFKSSFIDSVEVTRFSVALQIAFHLRVDVDAVEVVHTEPGREALISLFTDRKR